jgi:hypothetical protein
MASRALGTACFRHALRKIQAAPGVRPRESFETYAATLKAATLRCGLDARLRSARRASSRPPRRRDSFKPSDGTNFSNGRRRRAAGSKSADSPAASVAAAFGASIAQHPRAAANTIFPSRASRAASRVRPPRRRRRLQSAVRLRRTCVASRRPRGRVSARRSRGRARRFASSRPLHP